VIIQLLELFLARNSIVYFPHEVLSDDSNLAYSSTEQVRVIAQGIRHLQQVFRVGALGELLVQIRQSEIVREVYYLFRLLILLVFDLNYFFLLL